jgi:hypothetical protein
MARLHFGKLISMGNLFIAKRYLQESAKVDLSPKAIWLAVVLTAGSTSYLLR